MMRERGVLEALTTTDIWRAVITLQVFPQMPPARPLFLCFPMQNFQVQRRSIKLRTSSQAINAEEDPPPSPPGTSVPSSLGTSVPYSLRLCVSSCVAHGRSHSTRRKWNSCELPLLEGMPLTQVARDKEIIDLTSTYAPLRDTGAS
jgi:hypothetical protein